MVAGVATSTVNELTRVAIVGGKVNWSSVAIGGIQGGIYGYGEGLRVKANAFNQAVYGSTFDEDRKTRAQMLGLGNNSSATNTPSVLRLSDDEVFNNAMARQSAEKGLNGLNASYVLSPEQINAKNGGANFSFTNPPLKDVVNAKATNLAQQGTAQVSQLKGDTRFADNAANAFTRDRLARQESLIPNAVDRMLADKQIRLNNASNPVRLVDGSKNPIISIEDYYNLDKKYAVIDKLEASPLGAIAWVASGGQERYLDLGVATEGVLMGAAGLSGRAPAYTGQQRA